MNLSGPVGELKGVGLPPPENQTRSNFDEIWAIHVNLHKKNNEIVQNSIGGHVRELWEAAAPLNLFGTCGESFLKSL